MEVSSQENHLFVSTVHGSTRQSQSRQYFFQLEMASPSRLGASGPDFLEQNTQTVEETYELRGPNGPNGAWRNRVIGWEVFLRDLIWVFIRFHGDSW